MLATLMAICVVVNVVKKGSDPENLENASDGVKAIETCKIYHVSSGDGR